LNYKTGEKMKIAVTATGSSLDSEVDPRFGRCSWFLIVETDNMSFESMQNENANLANGAGIQSVSAVVSKGVSAVLTGKCGPKASQAFSATDIAVHTDFTGPVRQAVEQFMSGNAPVNRIPQADQSVSPNANQKTGAGRGMGGRCVGGSGRGMGMGGGRGMGGGKGMGGGRGMNPSGSSRS
jgi:predicted Fe-Mo cluster-binding NifX family protein